MFPLLVFTFRMDEAFLADIAETFLLESIELSNEPLAGHVALPLEAPDGSVLTQLQWIPPHPGNTLVRTASVPLAVGLIAFLAISGGVTVIARRNARKLEENEAEAVRIARTDVLTNLANRLALNEHVAALRKSGGTICLLVIDLNDFKSVNDKYGHSVGDELIVQFANTLCGVLREGMFAGRLGGDEFTILTEGQDAEEECLRLCDALRQETNAPFSIDGLSLPMNFALGYSIGDAAEMPKTELLRQADIAMYHAKQGRTKAAVKYDPSLEKDNIIEQRIIAELKDALETFEEFDVVYQPVVSTKTGRLNYAEALLRWQSAELGSVSPALFIPIAERTSLITEIGRFVTKRVFSDLRELPALQASINLSPVQLRSPEIVREIRGYAENAGNDPSRVTFEITETTLLQDEQAVLFITDALRDLGFKVALDDFGTGYSSIGYLRKIRFDELKEDKSFIEDIGTSETGENLLTSLAFLARALGLEIVAEVVETEEQLKLLTSLSYDMLQGYLLSEPISVSELSSLLVDRADWSGLLQTVDAA